MTQSKDGMGRTQGATTRMPGQRSQGSGVGSGGSTGASGAIELPMLPHPSAVSSPSSSQPAGDTDEMQDLLRKIASQIADAEQRQGAALEGMQARLTDLAGQAEAVKSEAPKALQSGLSSIETRIAEIAGTVEAAGREFQSGETAVPAAAPLASGTSFNMHVRGFGKGQVRGSNELASTGRAAVANSKPPAAATPTNASSVAPEAGGPWDQEAADALAKIFSDEDEASAKSQPAAISAIIAPAQATGSTAPVAPPATNGLSHSSLAPSKNPRPEPPPLASAKAAAPSAKSPIATGGNLSGGAAAAPVNATKPPQQPLPSASSFSRTPAPFVSATVAPAPQASPASTSAQAASSTSIGAERDWMNARFSEIAAQIERSLKESRPERALSALGQRFDKLESSLTSIMTAVKTSSEQGAGQGAGQAALQTLDAQVSGLKTQVNAAVQRLERLDALKGDIAAISQKLGALDRLEQAQTQVAAQLSGTRSDIDHLARALEQQKSAGAGSALAFAGTQAAADPRIDALQELMESQVDERREGESATVAVLQAIQAAIDQLTNRMGDFEEAVASAVLGGVEQHPGHHVDQHHAQMQPDGINAAHHQGHALQHAPEYREPARAAAFELPAIQQPVMAEAPARGRGSVRAEAPRRGPAPEPVQPAETAIPRTRRGIGNIIRPVDEMSPGLQSPGDDEPTVRGSRRVETVATGRDDMLGTARRAANQAAPESDDPDVDIEAIAARLPGQKRPKQKAPRGGFFTYEKAGSRPLLVVGLVALLAAGAGMLYGTLAERPQPLPVRMEKPKAPVGKIGAAPSPMDATQRADARTRGSDIIVGANTGSRSSTAADTLRAGNAVAGTADESDDNSAADMRAADLKEAALSILKPSTDTETSPLHTSSSLSPGQGEGAGITTGILIDSGAPMPSARDLRRYSEEQRMARISSQLGDKAVQKTEREHASPVSHTPDAVKPDLLPENAPAAAVASPSNAAGLPPAQIGPMSLRVAAAKGDPSAEFEVASRFAQGRGVPKDFAKAAEWYQRAASRGSAPAQYRLGGLFERGIGVKSDPARARAWYKRAAELGNIKAMHNLAVMYTQRDGGEPDYASASQWFTRAANLGLSDSQFNLAILHENGMGAAKSTSEAYKWYALAAERGDPEAAKRRDAIGSRLTPADIERSRLIVAKWRPQMTEPAANDPMLAGQAWRHRNGEDQMGGQSEAQQGAPGMRATVKSAASTGPAPRRQQPDAEIIDLSSATIDAQMKIEATGAAAKKVQNVSATQSEFTANPPAPGSAEEQAIMTRKRKVTKVQSSGDVEKMLTQFGYNPAALKKARPGGAPEDAPATSAQAE